MDIARCKDYKGGKVSIMFPVDKQMILKLTIVFLIGAFVAVLCTGNRGVVPFLDALSRILPTMLGGVPN